MTYFISLEIRHNHQNRHGVKNAIRIITGPIAVIVRLISISLELRAHPQQ